MKTIEKKSSLSLKFILIYTTITLVNVFFFSSLIYENQIDIIRENALLKSANFTRDLLLSLEEQAQEMDKSLPQVRGRELLLTFLKESLGPLAQDYMVFSEEGLLIYASDSQQTLSHQDLLSGMRAMTERDFNARKFYVDIKPAEDLISFYVPTRLPYLENLVLRFNYSLAQISSSLSALYRLIALFVIFILAAHLFFGFYLHRLFIRPVKRLRLTAAEIASGNLHKRAQVLSHDELGVLALTFNQMTDTLQDKLQNLAEEQKITDFDLALTKTMQEEALPLMLENDRLKSYVLLPPLSGPRKNAYEFVALGDNRYAFFIAEAFGNPSASALTLLLLSKKIQVLSHQHTDPADLLKELSQEKTALFFSAFYGIYDGNTRFLTFANASYPPVIFLEQITQKASLLFSASLPLGLPVDDPALQSHVLSMHVGDRLVFRSSGYFVQNGLGIPDFSKSPHELIDLLEKQPFLSTEAEDKLLLILDFQ
jgi:HAMP domain-containing protein